MVFKPNQIIRTETCPLCQGKGCSACGQFGLTGQLDNQKITFNLPGFLDCEARQTLNRTMLIRRVILILASLFLIWLVWSLIL